MPFSTIKRYRSYFLTPVIYTLKNCAFINCRSESDFLPNFFNSEISCRRHYIVYTLLYIWPQVSRNKLEHNAISISLLPIIFTTPYIIRTFPIIISSWKRCCPHLKKQNFVLRLPRIPWVQRLFIC